MPMTKTLSAELRVRDALFWEMVNDHEDPLTHERLLEMMLRRPDRWTRYIGWLDGLPHRNNVSKRRH